MSIFNEIGQIKQKVRNMADDALNHGWIDEKRAMLEMLTSIARAGADVIITYFAKELF